MSEILGFLWYIQGTSLQGSSIIILQLPTTFHSNDGAIPTCHANEGLCAVYGTSRNSGEGALRETQERASHILALHSRALVNRDSSSLTNWSGAGTTVKFYSPVALTRVLLERRPRGETTLMALFSPPSSPSRLTEPDRAVKYAKLLYLEFHRLVFLPQSGPLRCQLKFMKEVHYQSHDSWTSTCLFYCENAQISEWKVAGSLTSKFYLELPMLVFLPQSGPLHCELKFIKKVQNQSTTAERQLVYFTVKMLNFLGEKLL